ERWACPVESTMNGSGLQKAEQHVTALSEVQCDDAEDEDLDDKWTAFSVHMIKKEVRKSHELDRKIEQSKLVDLRLRQRVSVPAEELMSNPFWLIGPDDEESDSESDSISDADSISDSDDDSEYGYEDDL